MVVEVVVCRQASVAAGSRNLHGKPCQADRTGEESDMLHCSHKDWRIVDSCNGRTCLVGCNVVGKSSTDLAVHRAHDRDRAHDELAEGRRWQQEHDRTHTGGHSLLLLLLARLVAQPASGCSSCRLGRWGAQLVTARDDPPGQSCSKDVTLGALNGIELVCRSQLWGMSACSRDDNGSCVSSAKTFARWR